MSSRGQFFCVVFALVVLPAVTAFGGGPALFHLRGIPEQHKSLLPSAVAFGDDSIDADGGHYRTAAISGGPEKVREYTLPIPCNGNATDECGAHGSCVGHVNTASNATWQCSCESGYATPGSYGDDFNPEDICSAKRKSRTTAILLTVFILCGGAFYLGWIGWGVGALVVMILSCVPTYVQCCLPKKESGKQSVAGVVVACLQLITACVSLALWITLLVFVSQHCVDSDGVKCA
eukprot:TRINITY_DN38471_c0_g1_i1.p1 TRINITY_DN38471_c0_g1~~TRINITY_DN38471_c0_g1_i1.p1  ORF type:complete len:234 (-),score=26.14 TRINITY_DN38471_c0_g1_i1:418-1119(-)